MSKIEIIDAIAAGEDAIKSTKEDIRKLEKAHKLLLEVGFQPGTAEILTAIADLNESIDYIKERQANRKKQLKLLEQLEALSE